MSHFNPETEEISSNDFYSKYFFHRDGNQWYCLVHLHLGDNNIITYHSSSANKKQARYLARKQVNLRCQYMEREKNRVVVSDNKYHPCIHLLSLDKSLPTSREDDTSDDGVNSDSLPYSWVTKEQLDSEMDKYWDKKKLNPIEEEKDEGSDFT